MARVGIVSIFDMTNVGNRLQNYALAHVLRSLGHSPVVIPNNSYPYACDADLARRFGVPQRSATAHLPKHRWVPSAVKWIPRAALSSVRLRSTGPLRQAAAVALRRQALSRFTRTHLELLPTSIDAPGDADGLAADFDAFVVGSDQVWNATYRYGCPTDFLAFARPEQRVAYAASIGATHLPDHLENVYREFLPQMSAVSVREDSAAALVESMTGSRPPVLADPTLLVAADHWSDLADRAPNPTSRRFMSSYLLYRNGPQTVREIEARAATQGLVRHDIIAPGRFSSDAHGLEAFLRGIRDAEYVVTDSFHATVFSLLFRTPVVVLRRGKGQDDRVETLLTMLGVRHESVFGDPHDAPRALTYGHFERELEDVTSMSREWLEAALSSSVS